MNYIPVWEGVVEGYSKNQVSKNLWRFSSIGYEYEDVLHECFIVFDKCKKGFTGKDAPQFMEYYKIALNNAFTDLCLKARDHKDNLMDEDISDMQEIIGSTKVYNKKQLTTECKEVLDLILNTPAEILQMLGFCNKYNRWVHNNKLLCKLLDYDCEQHNLVELVYESLED